MSRHSEALAGLLTREPLPCIATAAADHDAVVICVGGAVRDALLRRSAADVDISVAGDLDTFVAHFARRCGRSPVPIGDPVRDTRRTRLDGIQVDVGRMLGAVTEDLRARDFTINAMAVEIGDQGGDAPTLIDPNDGAADLDRRTIRRVSEGALRDDPLRMLRAVRYFAALDGFDIEPRTRRAIEERAASIDEAAAERVYAEWAELLAAPRWAEAARLAFDLGIGSPALGWSSSCGYAQRWSRAECEAGAEMMAADLVVVRLAALIAGPPAMTPEQARAALIERRWPLRLAEAAARVAGWALALAEDGADTAEWSLADRVAAARAARLAAAMFSDEDDATIERIATLRAQAARAADERWVTGRDLRSWGLDEGPELGAVLALAARGQIERRWPDGDAARAWARRRAAGVDGGKSTSGSPR